MKKYREKHDFFFFGGEWHERNEQVSLFFSNFFLYIASFAYTNRIFIRKKKSSLYLPTLNYKFLFSEKKKKKRITKCCRKKLNSYTHSSRFNKNIHNFVLHIQTEEKKTYKYLSMWDDIVYTIYDFFWI